MKIKRKGAYEYQDLDWNKNQGGLVIAKAAEAALLYGITVDEFINNHDNKYDFMLRTKVPRSSRLVLEMDDKEVAQQNICRYYVSDNGGYLTKIMPPLEHKTTEITVYKKEDGEEFEAKTKAQNQRALTKNWPILRVVTLPAEERRIGIETGWKVSTCNDIKNFTWDINYQYYINEAKKLVNPLISGVDSLENRGTIETQNNSEED